MKIAFISLTGCEGCFYNVVNEQLFKLLEKYGAELVDWRLLGVRKSDEYDIAVVEGSVVSDNDYKKLQFIRGRSKTLIAIGTCALHGGVQAGLYDENKKQKSMPLTHYVKVDYYIRGCPARIDEFLILLEDILKGEKPLKYERRFDLVERPVVKISDNEGFLTLDSSKCIVCGRCIDICKIMQANVLNYVNRGILTIISTPYQEQFNNVGCHYCGLCVAYCPAGAIMYRLEPEKLIRNNTTEIYIEPEALASLAEAEKMDPSQILNALQILGYSKITIYSNDIQAHPGVVCAKSPVEYQYLKKIYPDLKVELLIPRIPSNAIYVTQCVAWRKALKNALTTRELQILLRNIPRDILIAKPAEQLEINVNPGVKYLNTLHELRNLTDKEIDQVLIYTMCPGGCLMGGGQPLSRDNSWRAVYEERKEILYKVINTFKQSHLFKINN